MDTCLCMTESLLCSPETIRTLLIRYKKKKCKMLVAQCVQLFSTSWTVAHQAPLPMEFSRQEYWNRLLFLLQGNLPDPGIKPTSPTLQAGRFFTIWATREDTQYKKSFLKNSQAVHLQRLGHRHLWCVIPSIIVCHLSSTWVPGSRVGTQWGTGKYSTCPCWVLALMQSPKSALCVELGDTHDHL